MPRKSRLQSGERGFLRNLQRANALHIFSPAANLTGRATVSTSVASLELEVFYQDALIGVFPPRVEIRDVHIQKMELFRAGSLSLGLLEFLVFLCAQGLLQCREYKQLCAGQRLSKLISIRAEKPFSWTKDSGGLVDMWPVHGLPYEALPDLIRRLNQKGLPLNRIIIYNHDIRQNASNSIINWPVVSVSRQGEIIKFGPYVGERSFLRVALGSSV